MNATYFQQLFARTKIVLEHGWLGEVTLRIRFLGQFKKGLLVHTSNKFYRQI